MKIPRYNKSSEYVEINTGDDITFVHLEEDAIGNPYPTLINCVVGYDNNTYLGDNTFFDFSKCFPINNYILVDEEDMQTFYAIFGRPIEVTTKPDTVFVVINDDNDNQRFVVFYTEEELFEYLERQIPYYYSKSYKIHNWQGKTSNGYKPLMTISNPYGHEIYVYQVKPGEEHSIIGL